MIYEGEPKLRLNKEEYINHMVTLFKDKHPNEDWDSFKASMEKSFEDTIYEIY